MHFIQKIHDRAIQASKNYKRAEAELLAVLQEVDNHKVFRELGFSSLFEYCLRALLLSESVAFNFITVARKAREVPLLKKEISEGKLSVTQARRITPILTKENQTLWIERAKTLKQRNLEREIAAVRPQAATLEKMRFVQKDRIQFQCGISQALMAKLKRVQDLLCQKKQKAVSLEETLEIMAECYLEKEDPLRKISKKPDLSQVSLREGKRVAIPISIQRAVIQRDKAQCSFVDRAGKRCEETRWLHKHHRQAVSQGGAHSADNIALLCFHHHRYEHRSPGPNV